jgi:hypothetical protein
MENNPTVGFCIGKLEGFLEKLGAEGEINTEELLVYLKAIEQAYIARTREIFTLEQKLEAISLNLQGWRKID